jgi:plastocyanin
MKNKGFGIIDIIVSLGLIAFIAWGINYITTKDFVTVRTPLATISSSTNYIVSATTTIVMQSASSTPVATSTKPAPTKTPVATTTPSTSSSLTVTFTDKGFAPASLTIKKGQTVTFINNSSGKMWVAANPFPTSSEYPAFNEKSGVATGSSWSFTFDKTGTWFYHNHYSPAQGAKIVVNAK